MAQEIAQRAFYIESVRYAGEKAVLTRHPGVLDTLHFGMYYEDWSSDGSIWVDWIDLSTPAPQFRAFHDCWHLFSTFADVFAALAQWSGATISPQQLGGLLVSLGFEDRSEDDGSFNPIKWVDAHAKVVQKAYADGFPSAAAVLRLYGLCQLDDSAANTYQLRTAINEFREVANIR